MLKPFIVKVSDGHCPYQVTFPYLAGICKLTRMNLLYFDIFADELDNDIQDKLLELINDSIQQFIFVKAYFRHYQHNIEVLTLGWTLEFIADVS